jgi:hypothetical protein
MSCEDEGGEHSRYAEAKWYEVSVLSTGPGRDVTKMHGEVPWWYVWNGESIV